MLVLLQNACVIFLKKRILIVQRSNNRLLMIFFLGNDLLIDGSEQIVVLIELFDGSLQSFFLVLQERKLGSSVD